MSSVCPAYADTVARTLILVVIPGLLLPLAASVVAWRRASRGRVSFATAASLAGLAWLLYLKVSMPGSVPSADAPRADQAAALAARWLFLFPLGAAILWAWHRVRISWPVRVAAIGFAISGILVGLGVALAAPPALAGIGCWP